MLKNNGKEFIELQEVSQDKTSTKDSQIEIPDNEIPLQFKVTFALLGIASLAGWNAILSAYDFFCQKYPREIYGDVTFYFPIPIMITNFFAGLACPALSKIFNYNQRIAYCLLGTCCTMIVIVLIAIFMNNMHGYILTFLILFFQGFIDSVNTNSLVALSSMCSSQLNDIYWTFTAASGITMNILRIINMTVLKDPNLGIFIYFLTAGFVYILSSISQIKFVDSEYFKKIQKCDEEKQKQLTKQNQQVITVEETSSIQKLEKYFKELLSVYEYVGFIPFFIWMIYVQTFMMFPGVSIFQKPEYNMIGFKWAPVVMIFAFNIGDMFGKWTGSQKKLSLKSIYLIVLLRFFYYILFYMTSRRLGGNFFQNDIFAIINILGFSISNGYATVSLMQIAPSKTDIPEKRDLINYVNSFCLTFGISCGTFLAIPLSK